MSCFWFFEGFLLLFTVVPNPLPVPVPHFPTFILCCSMHDPVLRQFVIRFALLSLSGDNLMVLNATYMQLILLFPYQVIKYWPLVPCKYVCMYTHICS